MKKKHDTESCAINSHLQLKQYNMHVRKFEDTKEVMRRCKSKKDRQHNGQRNKAKRTNNDLQNIT
jgi:hypothetical protein